MAVVQPTMPGIGGTPGAIAVPTGHARLKRDINGIEEVVVYPSDGGPPVTSSDTSASGFMDVGAGPTPVNDVKRGNIAVEMCDLGVYYPTDGGPPVTLTCSEDYEPAKPTPVKNVKREEFVSTECAAQIILPSDGALRPITRACNEDDDSVVRQNPPSPVKRADKVLYQDGKTTGAANPSLSSSLSTGAKIVGIKKLAVLGLVSAGAAACFFATA